MPAVGVEPTRSEDDGFTGRPASLSVYAGASERVTGIEPASTSLATRCLASRPHPHVVSSELPPRIELGPGAYEASAPPWSYGSAGRWGIEPHTPGFGDQAGPRPRPSTAGSLSVCPPFPKSERARNLSAPGPFYRLHSLSGSMSGAGWPLAPVEERQRGGVFGTLMPPRTRVPADALPNALRRGGRGQAEHHGLVLRDRRARIGSQAFFLPSSSTTGQMPASRAPCVSWKRGRQNGPDPTPDKGHGRS